MYRNYRTDLSLLLQSPLGRTISPLHLFSSHFQFFVSDLLTLFITTCIHSEARNHSMMKKVLLRPTNPRDHSFRCQCVVIISQVQPTVYFIRHQFQSKPKCPLGIWFSCKINIEQLISCNISLRHSGWKLGFQGFFSFGRKCQHQIFHPACMKRLACSAVRDIFQNPVWDLAEERGRAGLGRAHLRLLTPAPGLASHHLKSLFLWPSWWSSIDAQSVTFPRPWSDIWPR